MTSTELDDRARRYAGLERRLFEILGGWAPEVPEAEVKVALRVASFRHAWHAELWDGLVRTAAAAARPGDAADVAALEGAATTAERLAAMYDGFLPALLADYERLLGEARSDPAAGGPAQRVLTLVVADDRTELAEGRRLLRVQTSRAPEGNEVHRAAGGS